MSARISVLLPLLWLAAFLAMPIVGYSQVSSTCAFPMWPWLCDGSNQPGPGFPGSPVPYPLPTVPVTGTPLPGPSAPFPPYPVVPVTPIPIGGPMPPPTGRVPCPTDPLIKMEIAPTEIGRREGGTYGFTRMNGTKLHDGIDIKADPGTTVFSMYDGTVTRVEDRFPPNEYHKERAIAYGNFVEVTSVINGQTIVFKYAHLNGVTTGLVKNTPVRQGNSLGISGRTGNAGSDKVTPHVHIRARTGNGVSVDPAPYIGTKLDKHTGQITSKPC